MCKPGNDKSALSVGTLQRSRSRDGLLQGAHAHTYEGVHPNCLLCAQAKRQPWCSYAVDASVAAASLVLQLRVPVRNACMYRARCNIMQRAPSAKACSASQTT
jgi:hypothetical protein